MRYVVLYLTILAALPTTSLAQDITVSLTRLYVVRHTVEPTTHLEVQAATRLASITSQRHPLRLALYWGTWRTMLPDPDKSLDPRTRRRAHQVGIRLMHTPTSRRFQPFLILGYAIEFGAESVDRRYHIPMIETGLALSYAIYPNLRLQVSGSVYHLLVPEDDPSPGHNTLKVGLAIGRL